MQNLKINNSHPRDDVMNVRLTTNFPKNDIISNDAPPPCNPDFLIRHERRVIIFSGSERREPSDFAALSYRVVALTRNSMCTVFGNLPFIKRFEGMLPSGSLLASVAGDQATEENRQNLFKNFCNNDPFIHIFDDLASNPFFFCARRAFNGNFCMIATVIASIRPQVFERVGRMVALTQLEKDRTGWNEIDRAKTISIIHEGVDVSAEFHQWFEKVDRDRLLPVRGIDGLGMVSGVQGTA
jgi:hypothetical protein